MTTPTGPLDNTSDPIDVSRQIADILTRTFTEAGMAGHRAKPFRERFRSCLVHGAMVVRELEHIKNIWRVREPA